MRSHEQRPLPRLVGAGLEAPRRGVDRELILRGQRVTAVMRKRTRADIAAAPATPMMTRRIVPSPPLGARRIERKEVVRGCSAACAGDVSGRCRDVSATVASRVRETPHVRSPRRDRAPPTPVVRVLRSSRSPGDGDSTRLCCLAEGEEVRHVVCDRSLGSDELAEGLLRDSSPGDGLAVLLAPTARTCRSARRACRRGGKNDQPHGGHGGQ